MTFDAASYTTQLNDKVARLRDLLAPFDAPEPQVFDSPLQNFRLRAAVSYTHLTLPTILLV